MWTSFQITAIFVLKKCYCSPGKVFNFVAKNCPFYPENLQPPCKIVGKLLISIWKIVNLVTKDCYFVMENYPFYQFFVTSRKFVNLVTRDCYFVMENYPFCQFFVTSRKFVNLVTKDCYFVMENYPFCQFFVTSRKFVKLVQRICWFRPSKLFGPGILLISSTIYCSFYHGKLITSPGKLLILFRKIVHFFGKLLLL